MEVIIETATTQSVSIKTPYPTLPAGTIKVKIQRRNPDYDAQL